MGRIVIDSTAWSLALRRRPSASLTEREVWARREVESAIRLGEGVLLGVVRQEVLGGLTPPVRFATVRDALRSLPDETVTIADHERAAEMFNLCRAARVQGSVVDFLVCSVAERLDAPILTTDQDFERYATLLAIRLHSPA